VKAPHRLRTTLWILAAVVTGLALAPPARADVAHLTLQSQPGDFIGQGGNFDITYTSGTPGDSFNVSYGPHSGAGPATDVRFILGHVIPAPNTFSTLDFNTFQLGIPIQPGFYPDAQRAAFTQPGHPGLDVTFQNRGSNTLTGNFTISQLTSMPDATLPSGLRLLTFDATFEQHSEGAGPALFGRIQFTSSLASVPEPSTLTLAALGALGLGGYGWRRARATAAAGQEPEGPAD